MTRPIWRQCINERFSMDAVPGPVWTRCKIFMFKEPKNWKPGSTEAPTWYCSRTKNHCFHTLGAGLSWPTIPVKHFMSAVFKSPELMEHRVRLIQGRRRRDDVIRHCWCVWCWWCEQLGEQRRIQWPNDVALELMVKQSGSSKFHKLNQPRTSTWFVFVERE